MPGWTERQLEELAALDRMETRQIGYVRHDMFAADRCTCDHIVTEAGRSCPVPPCGCERRESRNRPLGAEGGDAA
jgi:hypothetical protein